MKNSLKMSLRPYLAVLFIFIGIFLSAASFSTTELPEQNLSYHKLSMAPSIPSRESSQFSKTIKLNKMVIHWRNIPTVFFASLRKLPPFFSICLSLLESHLKVPHVFNNSFFLLDRSYVFYRKDILKSCAHPPTMTFFNY